MIVLKGWIHLCILIRVLHYFASMLSLYCWCDWSLAKLSGHDQLLHGFVDKQIKQHEFQKLANENYENKWEHVCMQGPWSKGKQKIWKRWKWCNKEDPVVPFRIEPDRFSKTFPCQPGVNACKESRQLLRIGCSDIKQLASYEIRNNWSWNYACYATYNQKSLFFRKPGNKQYKECRNRSRIECGVNKPRYKENEDRISGPVIPDYPFMYLLHARVQPDCFSSRERFLYCIAGSL